MRGQVVQVCLLSCCDTPVCEVVSSLCQGCSESTPPSAAWSYGKGLSCSFVLYVLWNRVPRHSLHLLPSCVEELVRVLPAAQQEQADPDAVFARLMGGGGNEVGKGVVGRSRAEVLQEPLVADAVLVGPAPSWLATACVWGRGPGGGCFRLVLVDLPHLAVLCRQVRKTAVLRFLALPPAAQLVLLDRLAHPVYKYTRPLKAAANTCPVLLTPLSQSLRFAGAWTLASR